MRQRSTNGRFTAATTKGITERAPTSPKTAEETGGSLVGQVVSRNSLSAAESYSVSIHVRKAVSVIAINAAKATRRLFSATSEDEIISGDAFEWTRKFINEVFVERAVSNWELHGEMAAWTAPGSKRPILLDPSHLKPVPEHVRDIEGITHWRYSEPFFLRSDSGQYATYVELPADQVTFVANYNPQHRLRGSSPALTGATEISQNYYLGQFNKAQFTNGGHKDLIFHFAKGTKPKVAQEYVEKWTAGHSINNGMSFRVGAVIGDEVVIEEPGQTSRDGQYMELRGANADDILSLWHVPPILAGMFSKTRFDSAEIEIESFVENKLLHTMKVFDCFVQSLLDGNGFTSASSKKSASKQGHYLRKAVAKAREQAIKSGIIFCLDPDSLPVAAKLRLHQLNAADTYRKKMAVSFAAAATWAGIDRESNDADDLIFVESGQQPITAPAVEEVPDPKVAELESKLLTMQRQIVEEPVPLDAETKEKVELLSKFYKSYRKVVLEAADKGLLFDKVTALSLLNDVVGINKSATLQVHKDFLSIKQLLNDVGIDAEARMRAVKDMLNAHSSRPALRKLAIGGK